MPANLANLRRLAQRVDVSGVGLEKLDVRVRVTFDPPLNLVGPTLGDGLLVYLVRSRLDVGQGRDWTLGEEPVVVVTSGQIFAASVQGRNCAGSIPTTGIDGIEIVNMTDVDLSNVQVSFEAVDQPVREREGT
jgi:hypothetical protein